MVARRHEQHGRGPLVRASALTLLVLVSSLSDRAGWAWLLVLSSAASLAATLVGRAAAARGPAAVGAILAALLLPVVPSWVTTDLPFLARALSLGAGLVVVVSEATAAFSSAGWFDPDCPVPLGAELLRRFAGPATAVVTAAAVLPASWPPAAMPAVVACSLLPVLVSARLYDLDHLLAHAVPLLREQAQVGRDEVLREIHGALSTELRQLEQHARDYRGVAPELYERAVDVNSGLRETLLLADEERDTSTSADTVMASVLTLTRAEGATVTTRVGVQRLSDADRELVRYLLNELVLGALGAGATRLDLTVDEVDGQQPAPCRGLSVSVTAAAPGQPPPQPDDVERGLAQGALHALVEQLAPLPGTLSITEAPAGGSTTWTARWPARS